MTALSLDFFIITTSWLLIFLAYHGWGCIFSNVLHLQFDDQDKKFVLTWIGWSLSIIIFNLYNMFLPINIYFSSLFFGTGIIIFFVRYLKFRYFYKIRTLLRGNWILLVLLISFTVWVAYYSMLPPTNYDSGLYHFNSIRWLNEYAIVPGLANLHSRLGYNQTFFTYVASLNLYPQFGYGHNLSNGFLIILLLSEYIIRGYSYFRNLKSEKYLFDLNGNLSLLLLASLILITRTSHISSPVPDTASSVLQLLLFTHFVGFLCNNDNSLQMQSKAFFIVILSATAVTVKLSNIFYAGAIIIFLFVTFAYSALKYCKKNLSKPLIMSIIIAGMIISVWISRGYISSGYPFFPLTFGRINTEWTMPVEEVKNEAKLIYSWARQPHLDHEEVLNNWKWLNTWSNYYTKTREGLRYLILIGIASWMVLIAGVISIIKKRKDIFFYKYKLLFPLLTVSGSLLFWFFTVPDIRFAKALFFLLPIAAFLFLREQLPDKALQAIWNMRQKLFLIFLSFILFLILWKVHDGIDRYEFFIVAVINKAEPITIVELEQRETITGVKVWIPVEGDQCWDSDLPSTPYFKSNLDLRGDSLHEGFILRN